MSGNPIRFSVGASASLTTSYSSSEVGEITATDSKASPIPTEGYLYRLEATLTSISSATKITWYLAKDSAGEKPMTPAVEVDILDADSDASGGCNTALDTAIALDGDMNGSSVYVHAKTDAGTATAVFRITHESR